MKINKIISISYLLLISSFVSAQFSTQTELKYLKIINIQDNQDLIKGNLYNAEILVDSLMLLTDNSDLKSEFLYELSNSYYLVEYYDLALFSLLRQRCIFPNNSIEQESFNLFEESAYSNNLNDSLTKALFEKTRVENIPKNISDRLKLLLEISITINTKRLSPYIYRTGLVLRALDSEIPIWYQHWEYLTIVELKPKHIKKSLVYAKTNEEIYKQITDKKLKYKVYRKSINHYRKTKSFKTANTLLKEYRENKLGFILSIDAIWKSIWI